MSQDAGRMLNDASAETLQEYVVLGSVASPEADAVSDIIARAVRRFGPAESSDGFIQDAMQGVVRGTLDTHMDARETARGAIAGIMCQVCRIPGCSPLAVFTSAARALILETSAMGGRFDATVRGILDAAFGETGAGLTRQQVMSVVSTAILDATMQSIGQALRKGGTPWWNGQSRAADDDGRPIKRW